MPNAVHVLLRLPTAAPPAAGAGVDVPADETA